MAERRRKWRSLILAILSLTIVAAGCGENATPDEGLAVTDASTAEPTTDGDSDQSDANGDTDDEAASDGTDNADADETDADGPATDGDVTSPSQRLTFDLNHDVPERLDIGLEYEELKNLLIDVHGPTDDLAAEMNRVALFPENFPTIDGTDIYDFTVQSLRQTERRAEADGQGAVLRAGRSWRGRSDL